MLENETIFRIIGISLIAISIALAIIPAFTDCQSQGKMITLADGRTLSMKCHWSGIAEIGVTIPLFIIGVMMIANRHNDYMNLSILGVALGGLAIIIPAWLIGVCQTPTMTCVTLMRPILVTLGALVIGLSVTGMIISKKMHDEHIKHSHKEH